MATERLRYLIEAIWKGSPEARKASTDIKEVGEAGDKASKGTDKARKSSSRLGDSMKKLVAGGAVLAAGHQMLQFGKQSLAAASSAQETTSLLQNSLGPAARQFSKDIADIAEATGRSRFELEEGAATFVAMSRNMGLGTQASADFSAQLTQTAVDLGSFFNRAESAVLQDLQGALAGSSETMQKYGIDVRETTLKQRALEQGLIETGDTLDRATRAQLILSETMRQASDAMGDAERTADSYENTMRSLGGELHDFKVNVGEGLLDTSTGLAGALADQLGAMNDTIEARKTLQRAQEVGIITSDALTRRGAVRTEMTLEEIEALLESKEAALDRARAEDDLRAAMSDGQATVEEYTSQMQELTGSQERQALISERIASAMEKEREAAMNAAEAYEDRRRAASEPVAIDWDDTEVEDATEQAQQLEDLYKRIEGRQWEARMEMQLAGTGARGTEGFEEVLREKLTGVFEETEIPTPTVDTSPVDRLADKLGVADRQLGGVRESVMAVDDTPVRQLSDETLTAQERLDTLQQGSPYESDADHNLDSATLWARRLKVAIDRVPTNKTVNITTVGGVPAQGGTPDAEGQHGLDMVVPPGFPNDTFRVGVTSGERVKVTPQGGGGGGTTWNGDLHVHGGDPDAVIRALTDRGLLPRTVLR